MAWREPLWTDNETRWPEAEADSAHMTAEEFFALYTALPTVGELDRTPGQAAERLREWERAHPALARRHPGPGLLGHVYRMAAGRE
jgi:hypothetical protein